MMYWVERRLEFKTVPSRWEIVGLSHDTLAEAEARVRLGKELLRADRARGHEPRAKGGGVITEYRVRPVEQEAV